VAQSRTVEGFLKAHKATASRPLRLAIGSGFAVGLLVVVQAWFVAHIIASVLFDNAGLGDVAGYLLALPLVFLARAGFVLVSENASFAAAAAVKSKLRIELLKHLLAVGPVPLAGHPTGTLVTALTDNIEAIHPYYARYLPAASLTVMIPVVILALVFPSDWISGLVFLVTAPLIPLFMVLIGHGAERMNQRQWGGLVRMSGHLLDVIQGLTTLKLFNASRREAEVVSAMAEGYRRDTMAVLRVAFLSSLALEFFATVSIAIVAVLIGFRLLWGEMDFFSGFLVLLLAPEFYAPLRALGVHYHARMEAIGAAERIVELFELPAAASVGGDRRLEASGPPAILFEDVSVTYGDGRTGLAGLSFAIGKGERIALVGPSGAGKSTVINLLLGFLAPTAGRIFIDGIPLDEIDQAQWRKRIAWVPQRVHLFSASVYDNIAMTGVPHDAGHAERAEASARQSASDGIIARLPAGYATFLGEGGAALSGGEAQRIALARAFFRQPDLVLLDEPTAHLDRSTEMEVLAATEQLLADRTSLTIAHRIETVRRADRILVLEAGCLAAEGSHDTLLRTSALYAGLASRHGGAVGGDVA